MSNKKQFCKNGHDTSSGRRSSSGGCLVCHRDWTAKSRSINKIKVAATAKTYGATRNKSIAGRYSVYKGSAKHRGIPFNLTIEEFTSLWQKDCIVGCKIDTIGLDRIDNTKGYEISNLRPMCFKHNKIKSNYLDKDIIEFGVALDRDWQQRYNPPQIPPRVPHISYLFCCVRTIAGPSLCLIEPQPCGFGCASREFLEVRLCSYPYLFVITKPNVAWTAE